MTWLYLPPGAIRGAAVHALTASRSAPEQAASTSASTSPVPDIALWVTSSGKPSQQPLSWRGWKTKPWIQHLSGTTLHPSTAALGAASWISSLLVTRVSRSRSLAAASATPIRAISGRTSGAS